MGGTLRTLQCGRWLAASAVMLSHSITGVEAFVGPNGSLLDALASRGFLGVDFFFVLSGFIIFHVHSADRRSAGALGSFAWKRAVRIYVPYLPIAAGMVLLYQALPEMSASERDWSWIKSFTLLPVEGNPALSVAWTLVHEIVFYVVFALFFYTRVLWWGIAAWSLMIVVNMFIGLPPGAFIQAVFAAINLEFVFGMLCAVAVHRCPLRWWPWLLTGGLAGAVSVAPFIDGPTRLLFGFFMSLAVVGLVLGEWSGRLSAPRFLVLLGGASYAIYLVHDPLVSAVVRIASYLSVGPTFALLACMAVGTAAGVAYTILFDAPARRFLNSSLARGAKPRASQPA